MLKKLLIVGCFGLVGVVCFIIFWIDFGDRVINKFLPDNPWPSLQSSLQLDSVQLKELEMLVSYSYDALGKAYLTYDTSDFPKYYTDDPNVPLNREQKKYLEEVKANHTGLTPVLNGQGYLSYARALILNSASGAQAYQLQATLAAQGKTMGPDDYRTIGAPVPGAGVTPTALPAMAADSTTSTINYNFTFRTVTAEANRVEVTYPLGDGPYMTHTFLVKTPDGWRIAGTKAMQK